MIAKIKAFFAAVKASPQYLTLVAEWKVLKSHFTNKI